MSPRHRTLARLLAVAIVAATVASACSGSKHHKASSSPAPATTAASSTPVTSSSAPAPAPTDPLTGLAVSANPVVAVKIDDTANGRPQRGIDQADVVYIEQVEGGLSRLLAIFHTNLPIVEAVRSTRNNDPEILAEYGPIGFVTSGGAPGPIATLKKSNLRASVDDWGGPGLFRDPNRSRPYNLEANLATVAKAVNAGPAVNVGFTFDANWAPLASSAAAASVTTQVGSTTVKFNYDASSGRYDRIINGSPAKAADGTVISTPNVIVQYVSVTPDPSDVDVMGSVSKFNHTVGSGKVAVFRNGHRVDGSWSRAAATSPTTFTDASGQPLALAPGGCYVLLVATGTAIS